jgi:tetratricopeptide (TPR) repeat protein
MEKGIGFHKQALAIARETGNRRAEGADIAILGCVYADLGQVEKAIDLLEQALRIGQEIKDPWVTQFVSSNLERLRGGGEK